MEVRVVGTGCARCRKLYEETERALALSGKPARLTKVEKLDEILALGVLMTPALVVDGEIKCSGRVPSAAELAGWIAAAK